MKLGHERGIIAVLVGVSVLLVVGLSVGTVTLAMRGRGDPEAPATKPVAKEVPLATVVTASASVMVPAKSPTIGHRFAHLTPKAIPAPEATAHPAQNVATSTVSATPTAETTPTQVAEEPAERPSESPTSWWGNGHGYGHHH